MRIRSIRADNVLTFEKFNINFEGQFTLLVGPNGAGKTNAFRVVRLVCELVTAYARTDNSQVTLWLETFESWRMNADFPSSIEIDIDWTDFNEGALLSSYFQMSLANAEEITRELNGTVQGSHSGWPPFAQALKSALPADQVAKAWSGTLGCKLMGFDDIVCYFRPCVFEGEWDYIFIPPTGLFPSSAEHQVTSYSRKHLAEIWMKSLDPDTRDAVRCNLVERSSQPLRLMVDWTRIRDVLKEEFERPLFLAVDTEIRSPDSSTLEAVGANSTQELFRQQNGIRTPPNFLYVLSHLLRRLVISEDLLTPPSVTYSGLDWTRNTAQLTSKNLGHYLFGLKNGSDDQRLRFSDIQKTFYRLTSHHLDVKMETVQVDNQTYTESRNFDVRLSLVLQTSPDRKSYPLVASGSGHVEIAYLSALLNRSESDVIFLDEPGRSLHPQSLIRLRQVLHEQVVPESAPQVIVITHSPYIIPPSEATIVHRMYREDGITAVTQLRQDTNTTYSSASGHDLMRQDRWGRSPNWPTLLFASVVVIVDGETDLGALPQWYEALYDEPLEAIGASILSVGGKAHSGYSIRDLEELRIKWTMLVDGDSLKIGKDYKSGNIWGQLKLADLIKNATIANKNRKRSFEDQVNLLSEFNIFVMGESEEDNFEKVMKRLNSPEPPSGTSGKKVIQGIWWAQHTECPAVVAELFERVRKLSGIATS